MSVSTVAATTATATATTLCQAALLDQLYERQGVAAAVATDLADAEAECEAVAMITELAWDAVGARREEMNEAAEAYDRANVLWAGADVQLTRAQDRLTAARRAYTEFTAR